MIRFILAILLVLWSFPAYAGNVSGTMFMAYSDSSAVTLTPSPFSWSPTCTEGDPVQTQTVTFRANNGSVTLGASAAALTTGTTFSITSDTCSSSTITAGNTCTVGLSMSCATAGSPSDTLTVTSDASDSPKTVALSGTVNISYTLIESFGQEGTTASQAIGYNVGQKYVITTWTAGATYSLDRIVVTLFATGDPSAVPHTIDIRTWDEATTTAGETPLTTATLTGITGSDAEYTVDFATGASITNGSRYCVMFSRETPSLTNYARVRFVNTGSESVRYNEAIDNSWTTVDATATPKIRTYQKD
jgi:hypothetical protein